MEWLEQIPAMWWRYGLWFAGLGAAFGVLVRLMPCNPGVYWWKNLRAACTDLVYWFVVPLFLQLARVRMLSFGVGLFFVSMPANLLPGPPLSLGQLVLQCVGILLIQEVMLYWIHRAFHTRTAWKFHAVHHSPAEVDWTTTARFHPVNHLLAFGLVDIAVLLMGFSPQALAILVPFNVIYSSMVHANLNWTFGSLRYVFASPVFHRWHHTTEAEGLNKNFASTFPVLDVFFGTFYMPAGKLPQQFGNGEPDYPEGFWGQFFHPFRGKQAAPPPPPPTQAPAGKRRRKKKAA
jgi:sterol desaturase/sphingolipid hydroxylase (fatty acid hydroxylase superfamily)